MIVRARSASRRCDEGAAPNTKLCRRIRPWRSRFALEGGLRQGGGIRSGFIHTAHGPHSVPGVTLERRPGRWVKPWRHIVLDLTSCSDKFVSSLIELLVTAVNKQYLPEAERLLAALHVMRPRFRELHVYDVWLLMGRNRYVDAIQLLRTLESQQLQAPYNAYVAALMAICLFSVRDPSWRIFANEVLAREEDEESVALVNLLMGVKQERAQSKSAAVKRAAPEVSPFSTAYFMRA